MPGPPSCPSHPILTPRFLPTPILSFLVLWVPIVCPIDSENPLLDPSESQTSILGLPDPQPPSLKPQPPCPHSQLWPLCPAHLLRALHISMVTSTDKAMVVGKRDSNTSQSMPAKSGLSSEHFRKFL